MSEAEETKHCWCRDGVKLALLARVAVGGVFITLACLKLKAPPDFVRVLGAYDMLPLDPPWLIPFLAMYMPWLELLLGATILVGLLPRGSAYLAFVMLVSFTVAVLIRGIGYVQEGTPFMEVAFDCGCGTGVVQLWRKLLENGLLIFGAYVLCSTRTKTWSLFTLESRKARSSAA